MQKKIYEEYKLKNCSNDELYEQIKKINKKILDQYSRNVSLAEYDTDSRGTTKSLLPPEKVGVCVSKNLKKRWNLILGDSKKELPKLLSSLKSIDMFLHDSKHTYEHMMWEFDTIWPSLSDDGVLVSDDTNWNTSFVDFSSKVDRKNIQLVRDKISTETFGIILK